jgi:hypothetical protein
MAFARCPGLDGFYCDARIDPTRRYCGDCYRLRKARKIARKKHHYNSTEKRDK